MATYIKPEHSRIIRKVISIMDTAKRGYDKYFWLFLVFVTGAISIPIIGLRGVASPIMTFTLLWLLGHFDKRIGAEKPETMDLPATDAKTM